MRKPKRERRFYKKKRYVIPLGIILLIALIRVIAPPIIVWQANKQLADISPTIEAKIDDVDLALIWGSYEVENITARVRGYEEPFLKIKSVSASVEWRDVISEPRPVDVVVSGLDFTHTDEVVEAVKKHLELAPEKEEPTELPVRIARVDLKDSVVRTGEYPALTREEGIIIRDLTARATNITPSKDLPYTLFALQAKVLGTGLLKVVGEARINEKPYDWSVDTELRNFDLPRVNKYLRKEIPVTFTRGNLDLYAEAKSEDEVVKGYLKPFVKDLDVIKGNEDMKGLKHWLIEIVAALGHVAIDSDQVTATKVPFVFDGKMKAETGESLTKAFQHGYIRELPRGIENSIEL